jgi:hypothetical protein
MFEEKSHSAKAEEKSHSAKAFVNPTDVARYG